MDTPPGIFDYSGLYVSDSDSDSDSDEEMYEGRDDLLHEGYDDVPDESCAPTTTVSARPVYLPVELWWIIADFISSPDKLDYKTLRSAVLVSKQWRANFLPALWSTIDFRKLKVDGSLDKVLNILANPRTPEAYRDWIEHLVVPSDLVSNLDVLDIWVASKPWILSYYSKDFNDYLRTQICKRLNTIENLPAMLMVLAPNLHTVEWGRRGRSPLIDALFLYRHQTNAYVDPDVLRNLKQMTLFQKAPPHYSNAKLVETRPICFLQNLRAVDLKDVQCCQANLSADKKNLALNRFQNNQLVSLAISGSVVGIQLFGLVLRSSPSLQRLTMRNVLFRPASDAEGRGMTIVQAGDALRAHGHTLRHLDIYHEPYHLCRTYTQYGHLGSLRSLINLRSITVDNRVLTGRQDSSLDAGGLPLRDFLPTTLQEVVLIPSDDSVIIDSLAKLQSLQSNSRFASLSRAAIQASYSTPHSILTTLKQWSVSCWTAARRDRGEWPYKMCRLGHEAEAWSSPSFSPAPWGYCQDIQSLKW